MASNPNYAPASGQADQLRQRFARYTEDRSTSSMDEPHNHVLSRHDYEESNTMTQPSREEIDAKLAAMEARMDGRVASIEATISGFLGRQEERFGRLDDRLLRMEQSVSQTQGDVKSLKSTIIVTAVSVVLAIVLGVAAFNATVLSNMVASFESGKNTATSLADTKASQAEVKRQTEETAALLKRIQDELNSKQSAAPAPPTKK